MATPARPTSSRAFRIDVVMRARQHACTRRRTDQRPVAGSDRSPLPGALPRSTLHRAARPPAPARWRSPPRTHRRGDGSAAPSRCRCRAADGAGRIANVDLRRLHLALLQVGEPRLQLPHHHRVGENVQVAPHHAGAHPQGSRPAPPRSRSVRDSAQAWPRSVPSPRQALSRPTGGSHAPAGCGCYSRRHTTLSPSVAARNDRGRPPRRQRVPSASGSLPAVSRVVKPPSSTRSVRPARLSDVWWRRLPEALPRTRNLAGASGRSTSTRSAGKIPA